MSEQAAAGWYPDGRGNERYWDGSDWTDSVRAPGTSPTAVDAGKKNGAFTKLGTAVKKAATERKSAKEELARKQAEDAEAAGALVTSGVFGSSTIEIYQGGYVRVAAGSEEATEPVNITKTTPYEKLRTIKFTPSDEEKAVASAPSALEGAVSTAMTSLLKGGKNLMKGTVPGLAAAGIAHVASSGSRTAFLIIATDKAIHALSNQSSNGFIKTTNKGHTEVARALELAGNAVLDVVNATAQPSGPEPEPVTVAQPAAGPTPADRLRELANLHKDGILSDEEFAAGKTRILSSL